MSYGTGRIEKCTDNRPPFRTSAYKDGNRPHYSHTTNGLRLTAPADIDDTIGQFAALEIVGNANFSFGVGPWRQIVLGCGFGYMYDNPVGTQMYDHIDPLTGNLWEFERKTPDPLKWTVYEDAQGRRCMQTNDDGGHGFGHDIGQACPPNTTVFFSSIVSATYSNPNTVENLQWKSLRLQNAIGDQGEGPANSLYHKTFDKEQQLSQRGITVYYSNNGGELMQARNCYSMHHPVHDGILTLQEVIAFNGTPDNYDGYLKTNEAKAGGAPYNTLLGDGGDILNQPGTPYNLRLTQSFSNNSWRTAFVQDYYDEAASGNQTLTRYGTFVQWGSNERVLVGDNQNPFLCTLPMQPLPVIKHLNENLIVMPWFRGLIETMAGKWLHYFNDDDEHVGSIQVVV